MLLPGRPKIVTMAGCALLLAGGRPSGQVEDPMVWLNSRGDAVQWVPYSLSYWHSPGLGPAFEGGCVLGVRNIQNRVCDAYGNYRHLFHPPHTLPMETWADFVFLGPGGGGATLPPNAK